MFLAILRLILAPKREIAPHWKTVPPKDRWMRSRALDFGRKNALNFGKDPFFFLENTCIWTKKRPELRLRPFFRKTPAFGRKNALNFGEDLFFLRSLVFGRKNALNLPQSN